MQGRRHLEAKLGAQQDDQLAGGTLQRRRVDDALVM
jgi:hypothetical protein